MSRRSKRPVTRRSSSVLVPFGIVVAALVAAVAHLGCQRTFALLPRGIRGESQAKVALGAASAGGEAGEKLRRVENETRNDVSAEELLAEALSGVAEVAGANLGSRMQVRPLKIPSPPRGGNARFNFGNGQRGWVTALHSDQMLTSPAYGHGRIYLGGGFSSTSFFAFDAYDGEMDWAIRAPDGGPTAAIVKDQWVIFNTESCTIFVADAETGDLRWSRYLGDPLMSQPAAAGDFVLSAYPKNGAYEFGAFRLDDGEPVWTRRIPADVIQAPQVQGDSVYFATMDGRAHRLLWATGRVVWQRDVGASSALWVDGDHLLVTRRVDGGSGPAEQPVVLASTDGSIQRRGDRFEAPYLNGGSRDRALMSGQAGAWGTAKSGGRLGLSNVASGWAFQGSSPSISNGRAYYAVGGEIRARNVNTGEVVWRRAYAEATDAQAVSPPAVVGSQLVFGTVDGHLYAADIDTGMTLWAYDVGEPIHFQPIVAQGWVYVATGRGRLIGLEIGDPTFDGWHMWGGNAQHAGLVDAAGTVDPGLLASLERPREGTLRRVGFEEPDGTETATDATPAAATEEEEEGEEEADEPDVDLPLTHTTVEAEVSGPVARVVVTQQFRNPHDRPIEAVYLFPLPDDAAVDDMEMHVGDRIIKGRIQRRAQARETYAEARASGRRAALLEQQRPNLFAQRVANIQPGEQIDVQIRYVQMLPFADGQYELAYPMVAPPRFDPSHPDPRAPAADPLPPGEGAPPAVAAATPELRSATDVELTVSIDAGMPLGDVSSATHHVEIERRGEQEARVVLASSDQIPNRDFVLRYDVSGPIPRAAVHAHRSDEGGYFSLVVQPPTTPEEETIAARDFTFVVDTSSSMAGRPMDQAKAVMGEILSGLRPDDTFNIYRFADGVEAMSESPLGGDAESLTDAQAFVGGLSGAGATLMVPAVEAALLASAAAADPSRLSIVVLVTDGYIANEADVLRTVAAGLGESRLYALGVGSAVNRFLLDRAAEIGRGRAIVATLSEEPTAVASTFASYVDRPVFTDVTVDYGGLEVTDLYPRRLPDLFAGLPLVVFGRYGEGGSATVRVRGTIAGERFERAIEVDLPASATAPGTAVHGTLWARAAVRDRMNRLYLRDDPTLIEEVADIGLQHRMVTQWTSFVAVDETPAEEAQARAEGGDDVAEAVRATVSPARSLPGDPEIRIPAPADAEAVTVVLPFGETLAAEYEPELGLWSVRFLIPRDAEEGTHPVRIIITHGDGTEERLMLWYTVDSAAPLVEMEVVGEARHGAEVTIRAHQVITDQDLEQVGMSRRSLERSPRRAMILSDARRVQVAPPGGDVIDLHLAGPGRWEASWTVPEDAEVGTMELLVVVADVAANIRTQTLELEVTP